MKNSLNPRGSRGYQEKEATLCQAGTASVTLNAILGPISPAFAGLSGSRFRGRLREVNTEPFEFPKHCYDVRSDCTP